MSIYKITHKDNSVTLIGYSMTRMLIVADELNLDKVKCVIIPREKV